MVLVPMLEKLCRLPEDQVFPASIRIMVPICLLTLLLTPGDLPWGESLPYLLGSGVGGICSRLFCDKIRPLWLHRILGLLILLGGGRMLWR